MKKFRKMLCMAAAALLLVSATGLSAMADEVKSVPPSTSALSVDGKAVSLQAYKIDGYNYFKLRDIASILSGTKKQFDVGFDNSKNAIEIKTAAAYTPVGHECELSPDSDARSATPTASSVYIDGKLTSFTAYRIDNFNYFRLRDIAAQIDFGVGYDEATNAVSLITSSAYTPDFSVVAGNWAVPSSDGSVRWARGYSFDSAGSYYVYSKAYASYDKNASYVDIGSMSGIIKGGKIAGRYYFGTLEGSPSLSNDNYTFVKTDSSAGTAGTWVYSGNIDGTDLQISLQFTADGSLNADELDYAGTFTLTKTAIALKNVDGTSKSLDYSVGTDCGSPVLTIAGITYNKY